ncbi:methyltransferase-like protein 17, mitochondrial isoform X2 [Megalops cyprinoides]|uniref:methyltransferase-like protein 17, mitochondrial isoform X2 n=1 Tax=Megalops cyprinoides TaxID=118141 RepID=UPI00186568A3|nr:methyltransferase-like protein 17, mitochondrial isoform X2 [Megalops cyprinoides]
MAALWRRGSRSCALCQSALSGKTFNGWQSTAANPQAAADFLQGAPHRKHPGVTALKTVSLPEELQRAALVSIHGAAVSGLADRARRLTNYLWSRKRAVEDSALREKAIALEKTLLEKEKEKGRDGDIHLLETQIKKKVLTALRKTTYHWTPLRYDDDLAVVYLAARLAGGYAAVRRVLNEVKKRDPSFTPQSLLDFGSGVGTVLWAVRSVWGEAERESVCVDSSAAMNSLADQLLRGGSDREDPLIKQVYFRQFLPVSPKVQYDLVVSAFALSELTSQKERRDTVLTLWRKTNSLLVLVENGTKDGHQVLMEARDAVLTGKDRVTFDSRTPQVFAPCPHQLPCPRLAQESQLPCNYPQPYRPLPLPGSPDRAVERFSYLVLRRAGPEREAEPELEAGPEQEAGLAWARLIGPVLRRSRHVHCQLCCSDGEIRRLVVTARRHGRDMYRCARSSDWGDRLPIIQPEDAAPSDSE